MPKKTLNSNKHDSEESVLTGFESRIEELSKEDLKDMLLINTYKLALTKAQVEAITEILIKNKLTSYEDIWKRTNEIMKDSKLK